MQVDFPLYPQAAFLSGCRLAKGSRRLTHRPRE